MQRVLLCIRRSTPNIESTLGNTSSFVFVQKYKTNISLAIYYINFIEKKILKEGIKVKRDGIDGISDKQRHFKLEFVEF